MKVLGTTTMRSTSPGAEHVMGQPLVPVLDYGFVEMADYYGTDLDVVRAARVSYSAGTTAVRDDRSLIRYMMGNNHTSPFERLTVTFRARMPLFIVHQLLRHRTGRFNEESLRYSKAEDLFYVPRQASVRKQSGKNKQGGDKSMTEQESQEVCQYLVANNEESYDLYMNTLIKKYGLSREQARIALPTSLYKRIEFTFDLHNLLHLLRLRLDDHAQEEFRMYAEVIARMVEQWVPLCWEAFCDYRKNAVTFSQYEQRVLRSALRGQVLVRNKCPELSDREWQACIDKLQALMKETA